MRYFLFSLLSFFAVAAAAQQDSLANILEPATASALSEPQYVYLFNSTRVINAHSVEMLDKGTLDVRILHRFDYLNKGIKEMFGLDDASMRLGFDYGITHQLTIGIGRSTYRKELDAFIKWRITRQSTGPAIQPVSLVLVAGSSVWTQQTADSTPPSLADRFSHYVQLLIGRKFGKKLSLQLSPIFVHSNAPFNGESRNVLAAGMGMRYKINHRFSLTADYHHALGGMQAINRSPLSLGLDIETGGHTFQLHFSNATGMNERAFIYETYGQFFKADIRFGFNLSRLFTIAKRRR